MKSNRFGKLTITHLFIYILTLWSCQPRAVEPIDHKALVKSIVDTALTLFKQDKKQAITYIDSAFKRIPQMGPADKYSRYNILRRCYSYPPSDNAMSLQYADSMLQIISPYASDPKYNLLYAEAYLRKGDILFKQKHFNEAYLNFYEAKTNILPVTNNHNIHVFLFDFNSRLGNICYGQGRFLEAALWHKKSLEEVGNCAPGEGNLYSIQGSLDNIGICLNKAGMPDSALSYFNEALKLTDSGIAQDSMHYKRYTIARGVILGNMGTAYFKKGLIKQAEQLYKQSIAIDDREGCEVQDALITCTKLAELYVDNKRLEEAADVLRKINLYKDTLTNPLDRQQLQLVKAAFAKESGHDAEAYQLLQGYVKLVSAYKEENINLMSSDFGREFAMRKQQYELKYLAKQNLLKNVFVFAAILACVMAGVIIYLAVKSRSQTVAAAIQTSLHNKQLQMTVNALEKSNIENVELLSIVAHDLKNPINAIYSISDIMAESPERTEEDLEMLQLIKVSSKNLDTVIYDLLAANINGTRSELKAMIDIQLLLQESVSLLQYRAKEKNQQIILSKKAACLVLVNRNRIWRVINNLVVNAVKFSPANTCIYVDTQIIDKQVVISVQDQGIGIPPALRKNMFQLSMESNRPGTAGEETFGLGLYISRQIIEEQGGRIWLSANKEKGTTFYFSIPLPLS